MIKQSRFSSSVKFFENNFLKRWDIDAYHDVNAPCFFAGVYKPADVDAINNHKGLAVVWNTGRTRDIFSKLRKDIIVVESNGVPFEGKGYNVKRINIEIKDFTPFKPCPLGDTINWYMGTKKQQDIYGYQTYLSIKDKVKNRIVLGYQGNSMDKVIEMYKNCFISIKTSVQGGNTTATELAHMGRRAISNTASPFCIGYKDEGNILEIISEESKRIGEMPTSLINNYFTDNWQNEKVWL
jgi:hypothetical protein